MDTKPPPKPRRTLTEEQLGKKRRIDKLKHRENRAENKTRLENIERDVSFLRDTIGELLLQLRHMNHGAAASTGHDVAAAASMALRATAPNEGASASMQHHQHQQHQQHQHQQHQHHQHQHHPATTHPGHANLMTLPKTEPWNSPDSASSLTSAAAAATTTAAPPLAHVGAAFFNPADHLTERLYTHQIFPQEPLEAQIDMEALLADMRGQGPVVECRCGRPHHSDAQCTERITVIMAVEFNNATAHNSMRSMTAPRDPSLPDMLLHHNEMSNPLAAILSAILRQYDMTHVDSLCGIFLLTYRLLRWRYYPSPESMADVPAIMRPTPAQISIPHPKCLDFIPFPALRNYLCLNQRKDARHTVDLYLRSMRLVLPEGRSLMTKTERGSVGLNPDFEVLAGDLRNWHMGPPWSDEFPHLSQFLY